VIEFPGTLVVARLSAGGCVRVDAPGPVVFTTEDPDVTHDAAPICFTGQTLTFPRPGAVVTSTSLARR
jgi:hypothetical protein